MPTPIPQSMEAAFQAFMEDAMRYRWLRDKANRTQPRNWTRLRGGEIYVFRQSSRDEADMLHGDALDAAVDAARAALKNHESQS